MWVPGCGLSPLARLLAHFGLDVVATDVSPAAVEFQQNAAARFSHLTTKLGEPDPAGTFSAEVHDFRQRFRLEAFDLIVNVKAFQGFPPPDMAAIASVHAQALRPGRYAYFDTMNVQGERRDQLEQAFWRTAGSSSRCGHSIAGIGERCARPVIPHVFVLGQPMIPRTGEYAEGGPKWDADMARLREVAAEYRTRLALEQEAENSRIGAAASPCLRSASPKLDAMS